jgi:hypothetical protein
MVVRCFRMDGRARFDFKTAFTRLSIFAPKTHAQNRQALEGIVVQCCPLSKRDCSIRTTEIGVTIKCLF